MELTKKQTERQNLVDNAIHEMMNKVSLYGIYVEWDMHKIEWIRDLVKYHLTKEFGWDEQEFYPYIYEE